MFQNNVDREAISNTYLKVIEKYFDGIKRLKPETNRNTNYLTEHIDKFLSYKYKNDGWYRQCLIDISRETTNARGEKIIDYFENMRIGTYNNPYQYVPSLYVNNELVRGIQQGDVAASAVCDSFTTPPQSCIDFKVPIKEIFSNESLLGSITVVVVVCILIFVISVFVFKKVMLNRVDKDMTGMVNYHLERYHQMSTQDASI